MLTRYAGAAALAAAVLLPSAGAPAPGRAGLCELATAARAKTPSRVCLACHDGSAASPVTVSWAHARPGEDVHPVELDYVAASERNPRVAPPRELPPTIVLVDGRVACTSCHDGASSYRAHVAGGSARLCASCHRM